jgi:hypothetical protein
MKIRNYLADRKDKFYSKVWYFSSAPIFIGISSLIFLTSVSIVDKFSVSLIIFLICLIPYLIVGDKIYCTCNTESLELKPTKRFRIIQENNYYKVIFKKFGMWFYVSGYQELVNEKNQDIILANIANNYKNSFLINKIKKEPVKILYEGK